MPIQADTAKPIKTIDISGNVIKTDTNSAPAIKKVDSVGRSISNEVKTAIEGIADTIPIPGEKKEEEPKEEEPKEEEITAAKLRKEYLEVQRMKRQLETEQKKSKSSLSQLEAFEKAKEMAVNGDDPTVILKAANIDVVKFYQNLTKYALSENGKKEEVDPVKRELDEHKKRLDEYQAKLDAREKAQQEREDLAQHNEVILRDVVPMLQKDADNYEALLKYYGDQAAVEIYKNVWEIYQQTGKTRTFKEVADEMEKYWSENFENGIKTALSMKKFQGRFGTQSEMTAKDIPNIEQKDKSKSSMTLSNRQQITTVPSTKGDPYKGLTRDERVAAILSKFKDVP